MDEAYGNRSLQQDIKSLADELRYIYRVNKWAFLSMLFLQLLESIIPLVNIALTANIVSILGNTTEHSRVVPWVIITLALGLLLQLGKRGLTHIRLQQRDVFGYQVTMEIVEASINMAYERAEDPEAQVLRQRIRKSMSMGGITSLIAYLCYFLQGFTSVVLSCGIIVTLQSSALQQTYSGFLGFIASGWSAGCLLALIITAAIVNMICTRKINKAQDEALRETAQNDRSYSYLMFNLINDYNRHKDIRIYEMAPMLDEKMELIWQETKKLYTTAGNKMMIYRVISQILSSVSIVAAYVFIALNVFLGGFPIGGVILCIGAVNQFSQGCIAMTSNFADLRWCIAVAQDLLTYLKMPAKRNQISTPLSPDSQSRYEFTIRNLSFRYPSNDTFVLKNINMTIHSGEHLAIVGMNGSGKTTLIKLLCRLYEPTEGEILLNGRNIGEYHLEDYWNLLSVVFQDFTLFSFPLGQNVAASKQIEEEKAIAALDEAGFSSRLHSLPYGLQTYLYRHNDKEQGVELSGGEAQKVAIARALYKNAPIVILDEPTAALDPLSESEIYERFHNIAEDKTTIYISHRLSSCRFCDNIIVLSAGEIVQYGTHEKLLQDKQGVYFTLWNAQAQYYKEEVQFTNAE